LRKATLGLVARVAANDAPAALGISGFSTRQNAVIYSREFGCHASRVSVSRSLKACSSVREMDHSVLGYDVPGSSIQQSRMTVLFSLSVSSTAEGFPFP
jgi:hypothetical protein